MRFNKQRNTFENILGYCQCKQGCRTAGSCAHITAVLFYLIHRKLGISLPIIHPRAIELGSNLMDCLKYNSKKRLLQTKQQETKPKKKTRTSYKKRKK